MIFYSVVQRVNGGTGHLWELHIFDVFRARMINTMRALLLRQHIYLSRGLGQVKQ